MNQGEIKYGHVCGEREKLKGTGKKEAILSKIFCSLKEISRRDVVPSETHFERDLSSPFEFFWCSSSPGKLLPGGKKKKKKENENKNRQ